MSSRKLVYRFGFGAVLLLVGLAAPVFSSSLRDGLSRAYAGPPTTSATVDVIPHTPPSAKGPKPAPTPAKLSDNKPLPACVKNAYDALRAKTPSIRAKHPTDDVAFTAEYAKEKDALVSDAALAAAGCK